MNPFGNWQQHDVDLHNAKVRAMSEKRTSIPDKPRTAKAHNMAEGVGEVELLPNPTHTPNNTKQKIAKPEINPTLVSGDEMKGKDSARPARPSYSKEVVKAWCKENGIPAPVFEYRFHDSRKWRFDLSWITSYGVCLALEVQGGIWSSGRHTRGAALLKEWEKLNTAASMGWRILYCQPRDLCTQETAALIKRALEIKP